MKCRICSAENKENEVFCAICGARLEDDGSEQSKTENNIKAPVDNGVSSTNENMYYASISDGEKQVENKKKQIKQYLLVGVIGAFAGLAIVLIIVLLSGFFSGLFSEEETSIASNDIVFYSSFGVYQGELLNGAPNGQGTIYYAEGSSYEGGMSDAMRHGEGVYFDAYNSYTIHGTWDNNLLEGNATMYFNEDCIITFEESGATRFYSGEAIDFTADKGKYISFTYKND